MSRGRIYVVVGLAFVLGLTVYFVQLRQAAPLVSRGFPGCWKDGTVLETAGAPFTRDEVEGECARSCKEYVQTGGPCTHWTVLENGNEYFCQLLKGSTELGQEARNPVDTCVSSGCISGCG